jgi:hypothetical protein
MSKRKSTLQAIANEMKRPPKPRQIAQAQSFDHGMPIHTQRNQPRAQAQTYTAAFSSLASWATATEGVGTYQVESFDAVYSAPPVKSAPAAPPIPFIPVQSAARAPRVKVEALDLNEIDDELAAIRDQAGAPAQAAPEPPFPAAAALSAQPPAPAPEPAAAPANPHDVFDRMGRSMRYANTFDLGAIDLGRRFDEFDREMARDETRARAHSATPADHLEEDLATIRALSRMHSAANEAEVTPATPSPAPPAPPEPVVRHDVPLIAEQQGLSADAAAACMLLAWKHKLEPSAAAIINGQGGWSAYQGAVKQSGNALLAACGFEVKGPQLPNSEEVRSLLERFGPLWIGAPDAHVRGRVITGLSVDSASQQALLHIADARDERDPGKGANQAVDYTTPFMQFVRALPESSAGWIIAHLPASAS